jgi:hypothetical protein
LAQAACDEASTYCLTGGQAFEYAAPDTLYSDARRIDLGAGGLACAAAFPHLVPPGGYCEQGSACEAGICNSTGPVPIPVDVCAPYQVTAGAPCTRSDVSCVCTPTTTGSHICMPPPTTTGACMPSDVALCGPLRFCTADGHCAVPGGEGAPCAGLLYELECKPGLYCGPQGTCTKQLALGQACPAPFACKDSLCTGLVLGYAYDQKTPTTLTGLGPALLVQPGVCSAPSTVGAPCQPMLGALGAQGCALLEDHCDATSQVCTQGF